MKGLQVFGLLFIHMVLGMPSIKIDTEGEVLSDASHAYDAEKRHCSTFGCGASGKDGEKEERGRIALPGLVGRRGRRGDQWNSGDCIDPVCQDLNWKLQAMDKQLKKQQLAFLFFKGRAVSGNKFYVSDGTQGTFSFAKSSCEKAGGIMASPMNPEENAAILSIRNQYGATHAYLGINELGTKGIYRYPNGDQIFYTNWKENEPNNYQGTPEECVEIKETGEWNDIYCHANLLIICEF